MYFNLEQGQEIFSSPYVRTELGPTQPPIVSLLGAFPLKGKGVGFEPTVYRNIGPQLRMSLNTFLIILRLSWHMHSDNFTLTELTL